MRKDSSRVKLNLKIGHSRYVFPFFYLINPFFIANVDFRITTLRTAWLKIDLPIRYVIKSNGATYHNLINHMFYLLHIDTKTKADARTQWLSMYLCMLQIWSKKIIRSRSDREILFVLIGDHLFFCTTWSLSDQGSYFAKWSWSDRWSLIKWSALALAYYYVHIYESSG